MSIALWSDLHKISSFSGTIELNSEIIEYIKAQNNNNNIKLKINIEPANLTNPKAPKYKGNLTIPKPKNGEDKFIIPNKPSVVEPDLC